MYYFCPSVASGNDFMAEEETHHRKVMEILHGAFSRLKVVRLNAPLEYKTADLVKSVRKALA